MHRGSLVEGRIVCEIQGQLLGHVLESIGKQLDVIAPLAEPRQRARLLGAQPGECGVAEQQRSSTQQRNREASYCHVRSRCKARTA